MNIGPIKSEPDYERVLRRIEQLMEAEPGSKAGDFPPTPGVISPPTVHE
jgi:antitoxin component HigA of HigAB toxin-antitoxin module